jgi:hypothetical protein
MTMRIRLGHATQGSCMAITADIHGHVRPDVDRAAAEQDAAGMVQFAMVQFLEGTWRARNLGLKTGAPSK